MSASPATAPRAWAERIPASSPTVAVLITACPDVEAAVRGYRTVLPGAAIHVRDPSPAVVARARDAGAIASPMTPRERDGLARRFFSDVEADIYLLAAGADVGDLCVAPSLVDKVDGGLEFVGISRLGVAFDGDMGDRLLARTVDFLWGRGGDALASDLKACSRRFAVSFKAAGPGAGTAVGLSLHALRLRMPVGEVAALGGRPSRREPRGVARWAALIGLVARLLVEERPRRVCGVAGLGVAAVGIAALPVWGIGVTSCGLVGSGAAIAAAGVALDTLAAARQEVRRLGYLAIPRRASDPQSSVS